MTQFPISDQRNFYGRMKGKTMRPLQLRYLAEDLPKLAIPMVSRDENPERLKIQVTGETWLEIGYGGGEHLAHMAGQFPEVSFLGCEAFVNGTAMLLGKLRETKAANIRLYSGDIRDLLEVLPDQSIARVFLNYPDPWPKARHHRRRFVTPEYLAPLHRVMKAGAEFRMATDIPDYVRQTREEVPPQGFALRYDSGEPYDHWARTRYEAKAVREGRVPHYMIWERV
jgi:tRNA (guanine-N7-)-methyltransferase